MAEYRVYRGGVYGGNWDWIGGGQLSHGGSLMVHQSLLSQFLICSGFSHPYSTQVLQVGFPQYPCAGKSLIYLSQTTYSIPLATKMGSRVGLWLNPIHSSDSQDFCPAPWDSTLSLSLWKLSAQSYKVSASSWSPEPAPTSTGGSWHFGRCSRVTQWNSVLNYITEPQD